MITKQYAGRGDNPFASIPPRDRPASFMEFYMSEIVRQARKLIGYIARGGDPQRWWISKDFTSAIKLQIEKELESMLKTGVRSDNK